MSAIVPLPVASAADHVLRYGAAFARRLPIYRIEGRLDGTSRPMRVVIVDHRHRVPGFVEELFDEPAEARLQGYVTWPRLHRKMAHLADDADLILTRFHAGLGDYWFDDRYISVPEMVACRVEVPEDGQLPQGAQRRQRNNLRHLHKENLRWAVSHCLDDFEQFYRDMYQPFTEQRFGEAANTYSKRFLRSGFLRGGLMWILDGDKRVAGSLYTVERDTLRGWVFGVAGGDPQKATKGVTTAIYVFSFELTRHLGAKYCDLGLTSPALNNGILGYKKRWGAEVRPNQATYCNFYVRWDRYNPLADRLLSRTPVLLHDGKGLSGLTAVAQTADDTALERLAIDLAVPGLQRLCVMSPQVDQPRRVMLQDQRVQDVDMRLVPQVGSVALNHLMKQFSNADRASLEAGDVTAKTDSATGTSLVGTGGRAHANR